MSNKLLRVLCIGLAIILEEGSRSAGLQALVLMLIPLLMSPLATHAN